MFVFGILALYGYLWIILQDEIENNNDIFSNLEFYKKLFHRNKRRYFSLASIALLCTSLFVIWLIIKHVPFLTYIAIFAGFLFFIYWSFMYNAVAIGIFAQDFNPLSALKVSMILQITSSCLIEYLIAFGCMLIYILIIWLIGWAVMTI